MSLKELNGKLTAASYIAGFTPSKEDAALFKELFGNNQQTIQWAARMASYYESERANILKPKKEEPKKAAPKKEEAKKAAAAEDDELDLFGEETEEDRAALEEKKKKDAAKKEADKKKKPIAKSSILIEVKAWEDTTDLEALAKKIKSVEKEGLSWGAHKLEPVAYGVKKLVIMLTIVDDLVTGDDIEDIVMQNEEEVQSMDVAAWNKL